MEWICGNGIAEIGEKKKLLQLVCDNAIAEIGGKILWQLWQCHCRKWEEKKIVVAEIWEGIKKKCYVHNIFTTSHMWLVIISSNLNLTLRLLF